MVVRFLDLALCRCGYDMIEGEEYLGATGLHLAIAYGNDEVAEMLILSKSMINGLRHLTEL